MHFEIDNRVYINGINMLKKILVALALTCFSLFSHANEIPNYPFIHVNGTAMIHVYPDIGEVDIEIASSDVDAQLAWKTVEEGLNNVKVLVSAHNVAGEDLSVQNIEARPQKLGDKSASEVQVPVEMFAAVHITVRDLSKWQEIITSLMKIQNIKSMAVAYTVAKKFEIEANLVTEAIADARRKAANIAKGIGGKVGPVNAVAISPLKNLTNSFGLSTVIPFQRTQRPNAETDYALIAVQRMVQEVDMIYRIK